MLSKIECQSHRKEKISTETQQSFYQRAPKAHVNSIGKLEGKIMHQRNLMRKEKISKKRADNFNSSYNDCTHEKGGLQKEVPTGPDQSQEQKDFFIELLYANIRGLNDAQKQQQLFELINANPELQAVLLTETKLTKQMKIKEWKELQSQYLRAGGCWSAIKANGSIKKIKYFDSTLTWMSSTFGYTPIHFLTIYIPPQNPKLAARAISNLEHTLSLIFDRLPSSRVIIAGDMNEHRAKVEAICKNRGLKPLIPEGTPTHDKGGHLDQVITNLNLVNIERVSAPFTDHSLIHAKLHFQKNTLDLDIRSMPKQTSKYAIKKCAQSQNTIDKLKSNDWSLSIPAIEIFKKDIHAAPLIKTWYQSKGKWRSNQNNDQIWAEQDLSWNEQVQQLEKLHRNGDKVFISWSKSSQKSNPSNQSQRGIKIENGESIFNTSEVNQIIRKHLETEQLQKTSDIDMNFGPEIHRINSQFSLQEVELAVGQCNFQKAIGPDGFDGSILFKDTAIKTKVISQIAECLNQGRVPEYLTEGRLIPLSICQGEDCIEVEKIRPIIVRSHISKIIEKVLLNRVQDSCPHLLRTQSYQEGFKRGRSSANHLASILLNIKTKQRAAPRKNILLIDLSSAYNNISRIKLRQCLFGRAKTPDEAAIADLIMQLHWNQKIIIGEEIFFTYSGVAQGSVLSPLLFNMILEEALKTSITISNFLKRGDLRAFADDLQIQSSSLTEISNFLEELERIGKDWGLFINKKKCILIKANEHESDLPDIKSSTKAKYLGMTISQNVKEISQQAKADIKKYISFFNGRVRNVQLAIKEELIISYARSLIIYFGSPLMAAQIWDAHTIESIERQIYRKVHLLPNDINGGIIVNIARQQRPVASIIKQRAQKIIIHAYRQEKLFFKQSNSEQQQPQKVQSAKLYIPRDIANILWATSRGSTMVNFNNHHYCKKHSTKVDRDHLKTCDLLPVGDLIETVNTLKQKPIQEFSPELVCSTMVNAMAMLLSIKELEKKGIYERVLPQQKIKDEKDSVMEDQSAPASNGNKRPRGRPKKERIIDRKQMRISFPLQSQQIY